MFVSGKLQVLNTAIIADFCTQLQITSAAITFLSRHNSLDTNPVIPLYPKQLPEFKSCYIFVSKISSRDTSPVIFYSRVRNSLFGFLSESLVFSEQKSEIVNCSSHSFVKSNRSKSLMVALL